MAYHVDQLVGVGFLKVVRTRKVRAIDERLYGRVARTIVLSDGEMPTGTLMRSFLAKAQREAVETDDDKMRLTIRHAVSRKNAAKNSGSRSQTWRTTL